MSLSLTRRPSEVRTHRPKNSRRAHLVLEDLEQRTVLSHMAPIHAPHAHIAPFAPVAKPAPAATSAITGLTVNNITSSNGQLVANATVTGTVKNQAFAIPAVIPVVSASITTTPSASAAATAAPVTTLHLTLGAINLSVLGLNVHIGSNPTFGDTAPITINLVGIPTGSTYHSAFTNQTYNGGVLGDVVAGLGNLIGADSNGGGLSMLLNQITGELTDLLNGLLGHASSTPATPSNQTPVLNLPIGPIGLDLLGALVETSAIDVTITATPGPGNLLGNLLSGQPLFP
jgi:hypothetical protein